MYSDLQHSLILNHNLQFANRQQIKNINRYHQIRKNNSVLKLKTPTLFLQHQSKKQRLKSKLIELIMHHTRCLCSIQSIISIKSAVECRCEVIIIREVLLLHPTIRRSYRTISHILCMVHCVAQIQSVLRILRIPFSCRELDCFLKVSMLGIWIDSFPCKSLFENLTFYKFLSSLVIIERCSYLSVCRDYIFFEIQMFRSHTILQPRTSIILVSSIIETAFECTSEEILSILSHIFQPLNITPDDSRKAKTIMRIKSIILCLHNFFG